MPASRRRAPGGSRSTSRCAPSAGRSIPELPTGVRSARAVRLALPWRLEPERAALLVRDDDRPFALIGRWAGGGALIGSQPVRVARADHDPFALLEDVPLTACRGDSGGGGGAVGGGWFGYLGYRLAERVEAISAGPPAVRQLPDFELGFYDHLVHLDAAGTWWFEALWTEPRAAAIRARLVELCRRADRGTPRPRPFSTSAWTAEPGAGGHALAIEACRERIHAGDLFQANLAQRVAARMTGEPVDLFATGVPRLRPDRAAWLGGPWGSVVSLSPELFLERHGRRVRSAPIKGTCHRPQDASAARASAAGLGASVKDRAENLMIVDLVRNDLGRVCETGSIRVAALAQARAHAGVWHLVSEIVGTVAGDVGDGELVRAAFPPGSVTGAPKVAALDVIAELESTAREVYTGAIGFVSPLGGLELSVAIRTFEFSGEDVWLGVGGGIVADSVPIDELGECLVKLEPVLSAIGGRQAPQARDPRPPWSRGDGHRSRRGPTPLPARLAARPTPRPDPGAGVFETMLVGDGRAVCVEGHLSRLAASVEELYGLRLPEDAGDRVAEAAAGEPTGPARLRLSARPARGALELSLATYPLAAERPPVALRTMTIPGGLGAHKWIDRRLIEGLERSAAPEQPIFGDVDGRVLESSRANVFVVEGGRLVTPPVAGRLLPGLTRARVIRLARGIGLDVRVEEISAERLRDAAEVFVTGSIGGVEPVTSLDGRALGPPGGCCLLLADGLAQAGTDSASPAASRRASAFVVCSQVKSSSSRPK
ncbi:MAG TPA: aminodeoxychorismate synthase component I [Solirubrobacteraceae bacterium]|jgi:para-aminobenzoate synthetase/4-amino-4-deoxychorismate lyase|nr:aminodeoxychorismate synthase component I [Solirubrobacteraceae bacterium]